MKGKKIARIEIFIIFVNKNMIEFSNEEMQNFE